MSNDLNELELILRLGETLKTAADAIKGLAVMQSELSAQIIDLQFKFRELELNVNEHLRGIK